MEFFRREAQKLLKQPKVFAALLRGGRNRWEAGGAGDEAGPARVAAAVVPVQGAIGNNASATGRPSAALCAAADRKATKQLEVTLLPNASYHRVFSSIRQSQLNYEFLKKFTADADLIEEDEEIGGPSTSAHHPHQLAPVPGGKNAAGGTSSSANAVAGGAALSSSMEQMLMDEEFRHSSMVTHKTVRVCFSCFRFYYFSL